MLRRMRLLMRTGLSAAVAASFFFSSRRRHTRWPRDWSSDVCSSDLSRGRLRTPSLTGRAGHRVGHARPGFADERAVVGYSRQNAGVTSAVGRFGRDRIPFPAMMGLRATFLTDGGQSAASVAELLAEHLGRSRRSMDIAIYDLKLSGAPGGRIRQVIQDGRARGVAIRLVFNQERARTRPLPPPGFIDYDFLHSLQVDSRAIPGVRDLMHHKYVVSDAGTRDAAVWT